MELSEIPFSKQEFIETVWFKVLNIACHLLYIHNLSEISLLNEKFESLKSM